MLRREPTIRPERSDREVVEGRNVQVIFGSDEQWLFAKWKKSRTAEHFINEYGFDQQRLIWYVCRLWDMVFS